MIPTLDTHRAMQIFHPVWLVNGRGEHPEPFTLVTAEDVERGGWRFNAAVAPSLGLEARTRSGTCATMCASSPSAASTS